jgi:hypothetical protein
MFGEGSSIEWRQGTELHSDLVGGSLPAEREPSVVLGMLGRRAAYAIIFAAVAGAGSEMPAYGFSWESASINSSTRSYRGDAVNPSYRDTSISVGWR